MKPEQFEAWALKAAAEARAAGAWVVAGMLEDAVSSARQEKRQEKAQTHPETELAWTDFVMQPRYKVCFQTISTTGHTRSLCDLGFVRGEEVPTLKALHLYVAKRIWKGGAEEYHYFVQHHESPKVLLAGAVTFNGDEELVLVRKAQPSTSHEGAARDELAAAMTACELGRGREVLLSEAVSLRDNWFIDTEMKLTELGLRVLKKHRENRNRKDPEPA